MNTSGLLQESKQGRRLPWALGLLLLSSQALVAESGQSTIRLRPSHEDIAKKRAAGPKVSGLRVTPVDPEEVSKTQIPNDFLKRSTILSYRGNWTIVPKNAVMHIPASLQDRIVDKPEGALIPWAGFCLKNRGWLHLQKVRMSDARGDTTLSEGAFQAHQSLGRVVVAVYKGGPISMPVAPPVEASKSL
jgi:hypothetical protein